MNRSSILSNDEAIFIELNEAWHENANIQHNIYCVNVSNSIERRDRAQEEKEGETEKENCTGTKSPCFAGHHKDVQNCFRKRRVCVIECEKTDTKKREYEPAYHRRFFYSFILFVAEDVFLFGYPTLWTVKWYPFR